MIDAGAYYLEMCGHPRLIDALGELIRSPLFLAVELHEIECVDEVTVVPSVLPLLNHYVIIVDAH